MTKFLETPIFLSNQEVGCFSGASDLVSVAAFSYLAYTSFLAILLLATAVFNLVANASKSLDGVKVSARSQDHGIASNRRGCDEACVELVFGKQFEYLCC